LAGGRHRGAVLLLGVLLQGMLLLVLQLVKLLVGY
jgi:hypothetical protein